MDNFLYTVDVFLLQFFLAIVLFFLINFIGKHSYSFGYIELSIIAKDNDAPALNFLVRNIVPVVFIILVSTILYSLNFDSYIKNIYYVIYYYFFFRIMFNLFLGRFYLINWKEQFISLAVSLLFSYVAYEKIIQKKVNILPDFNSFVNELWVLIMIFLFHLFNNMSSPVTMETNRRKQNYVINKYNKYYNIYSRIINLPLKNMKLELLIYSIIIYESFNRPMVFRFFERILFSLGKAKTLGIMQITTDNHIDDETSVRMGVKKILLDLEATIAEYIIETKKNKLEDYEESIFREIILKYNKDYSYHSEVSEIYNILSDYRKHNDMLFEFKNFFKIDTKSNKKKITSKKKHKR